MYKMAVASGLVWLAALAFQPMAAQADTEIGIGVGIGGGYHHDSPRHYVVDPYEDDEDDEYGYISCREGRRILRDRGFYRVTPIRCRGNVYRYEAERRDRLWSIRLSARSGRIISARVIGELD